MYFFMGRVLSHKLVSVAIVKRDLAVGDIPHGTIIINVNIQSVNHIPSTSTRNIKHASDIPVGVMIHRLHIIRLEDAVRLRKILLRKRLPSIQSELPCKAHLLNQREHTVSSLPVSLIFFPISLLTHSDLSPIEELIPGTTRGMLVFAIQ